MLARRLEKPRKTGERRRILVRRIRSGQEAEDLNTGKSKAMKKGAVRKARIPATITKQKKKENAVSINSLAASSPFSNLSIKKGTRTDMETMEATVTKRISGILKAE